MKTKKQNAKYFRDWRRRNPEAYRKYQRDRYWSSSEIRKKHSEKMARWYQNNRETIRAKQKLAYKQDINSRRTKSLEYYRKNRDKINARKRKRYQLDKILSKVPRLEDVPSMYESPADL